MGEEPAPARRVGLEFTAPENDVASDRKSAGGEAGGDICRTGVGMDTNMVDVATESRREVASRLRIQGVTGPKAQAVEHAVPMRALATKPMRHPGGPVLRRPYRLVRDMIRLALVAISGLAHAQTRQGTMRLNRPL